MSTLQKGIGSIKVNKLEDGTYKATANGIEPVIARSESAAILGIQAAIKTAVESDESKQTFRIVR